MADPHRPAIFPYATPDPHRQAISPYDPQAPKIRLQIRRDQRSSSTNPNQPRQANILNLRYCPANPTPTKSRKSYIPASGGHRHLLHVRPWSWSCAHLHGHGHALTFKGTRTAIVIPLRARARPCQRPGTPSTRPAYGSHKSSANPVHSSALRLRHISADLRVQPAYSKRLGGMGMASTTTASLRRLRRQGASTFACNRAIGPEGPITVKPKGLTDLKARLVVELSGLMARLQSSLKAVTN